MKKIFILVILFFTLTCGMLVAQDKNIVSMEPIRVWNGLRLKYERVLTNRFATGTQATIYYGYFPGYQVAPFFKYYFKANAPQGFYIMPKIPFGAFESIYNDLNSKNNSTTEKEYFLSSGLGLSVGWQMIFGAKENWSIDFNIGVKFVNNMPPPVYSKDDDYDYDIDYVLDTSKWYLNGPGSILDCLLTVGYKF